MTYTYVDSRSFGFGQLFYPMHRTYTRDGTEQSANLRSARRYSLRGIQMDIIS